MSSQTTMMFKPILLRSQIHGWTLYRLVFVCVKHIQIHSLWIMWNRARSSQKNSYNLPCNLEHNRNITSRNYFFLCSKLFRDRQTNIHTYIHTYIRTYIHTYIYTQIHTYIRTHTYIHTYIHVYIHTYIHTHTYIYIHTIQYQ